LTKDVLVSIQGLQFVGNEVAEAATDEEIDKIETICMGEYYYRNDAHFILYEELVEDFGKPVKNIIKLRGKEFVLTKKGPVNMQLLLAEGKKTMTDYATPFGNILVAFDTREVALEEHEDCIQIHIKYGLEANYQFISDCNIIMKVKSSLHSEDNSHTAC